MRSADREHLGPTGRRVFAVPSGARTRLSKAMRQVLVLVGFVLGVGGVALFAVGVVSVTVTAMSRLASAVADARREHQRLAR